MAKGQVLGVLSCMFAWNKLHYFDMCQKCACAIVNVPKGWVTYIKLHKTTLKGAQCICQVGNLPPGPLLLSSRVSPAPRCNIWKFVSQCLTVAYQKWVIQGAWYFGTLVLGIFVWGDGCSARVLGTLVLGTWYLVLWFEEMAAFPGYFVLLYGVMATLPGCGKPWRQLWKGDHQCGTASSSNQAAIPWQC